MAANQPFADRLRTARLRKAAKLRAENGGRYSQEKLGIDAGIAEETASARMNQYERGVHLPELNTSIRLAKLLEVPLAYLFCVEDDLAELLLIAYNLPEKKRAALLAAAAALAESK